MEQCLKCKGRTPSLSIHRCLPEWRVRWDDQDEQFSVFAVDAESSACDFVEHNLGSEAPDRSAVVVTDKNGTEATYTVHYELVPTFYAVMNFKVSK